MATATPDDNNTTPPATELGHVQQYVGAWGGSLGKSTGVPSWDALMNDEENVPELRGQRSSIAYDRMMTDAQVAAIWASILLPLMRYRWVLRRNGADANVLERFAENMGLPIEGSTAETNTPSSTRVNFHEHLRAALRSLRLGYMPFEQVGYITDDNWFMYRKLGERPPSSVDSINVAADGGLLSITQSGAQQGIELPVNRLVMYSWEREGANWQGRSILRPMYRNWLIKDRLLRVDALKHERNGMGIPVSWAPPGATNEVMLALNEITAALKVGEESGVAMPPGSDIKLMGVNGTLPDTIASVQYHDSQMAKAGVAQFLELGTSASGNRALGETFAGMFGVAMDYVAMYFADVFNQHVIRDWVRWNKGADAAYPILVPLRDGDPEMPVADLRSLIEVGAITPYPELEQALIERAKLPMKSAAMDDAPAGAPFGYDLDSGIITIDERRAQLGLAARPDGLGTLTVPEFLAQFGGTQTAAIAGIGGTPPAEPATVPDVPAPVAASRRLSTWSAAVARLRDATTNRGRGPVHAGNGAKRAAEFDATRYPENVRRQPYEHEVKAATDFTALDKLWADSTSNLLKAWGKVRDEQDAALIKQVVDANGDLEKLALVTAPDAGSTKILTQHMLKVADDAAAMMASEAKAQGFVIPKVGREQYQDLIEKRAALITSVMNNNLAQGAIYNASRWTGGALAPAQVAEQVGVALSELSESYLKDRLGNALTTAQNSGRFAAVDAVTEPKRFYASELLDTNTCSACADIDGKEFADQAEALEAYPSGGYVDCQGGERCRGTIVVVFDETTPTIEGEQDDA
jgi:hypothetical protein